LEKHSLSDKTNLAVFPITVDITTLSIPQLRALQSRLSSELEHLTNSHAKLRAAQSKFRDCVRSINDGIIGPKKTTTKETEEDKSNSILVPLTSSLYVKGRLANRDKVIVDVGTGFYVEKVRGYFICLCAFKEVFRPGVFCISLFLPSSFSFLTKLINIRQTASKAIDFYNRKAKELETNLQDLEKIVQGKSSNLRVIEDGKSPTSA
jgi:prefoldin alpha subunit